MQIHTWELTKKELFALHINSDDDLLREIISNVLLKKSWNDRQKIDKLLFFDHSLHGNLDMKSKVSDKKRVMTKSRIIYRAIKEIDKKLGENFLQHQDDV